MAKSRQSSGGSALRLMMSDGIVNFEKAADGGLRRVDPEHPLLPGGGEALAKRPVSQQTLNLIGEILGVAVARNETGLVVLDNLWYSARGRSYHCRPGQQCL